MGPDRNKHLRNVAIVIALALALWLLPGGDTATKAIVYVLSVALWAGLLFFGFRLYMEHRMTIFSLDDRMRALLYGSLALVTLTLVGTRRLWDTGGLGALIWLGLIGLAIWGVIFVWRAYREY